MGPDAWPRVKEVFAGAIPIAPTDRAAYLDAATGKDFDLRMEVEALLASHDAAGAFLETAAELPAAATVTLSAGRRIGHYQVGTLIGAGGMGEVFEARDTRLDRAVAIKVLPATVASDPIARDRFEREARTVAALNHPHICTLHDIGSADGIDFLVMEHLEGETLAARLERGRMSLEQALQYGTQIASALDAVHRAGIVHRDLKPANVMLTRTGAKLLDFGLSKAALAPASLPTGARVPVEVTSAGAIFGTLQYMSPEQLDGAVADARSDIFAFGTVLYEMIQGRKAFVGETHSDVIAAIREANPALAVKISPSLDRLIRTCLARDPDDRWQSARDLSRELMWIASGESLEPVRPHRQPWLTVASAVVVTAVVVAALFSVWRDPPPPATATRFEIPTPATSEPTSFAISPDGEQLAFVAADDGASKLWLRRLDELTARPIAGTDGATSPFWAPHGQAIAFFADGKLKRLDLDGRAPRVLADAVTGRGGSWSRDNVILFAPSTSSGLLRVSAEGGGPQPATRLAEGHNSHRWPQFLPDGRRFLFLSTQVQAGSPGIYVGSLDSGELTRVLDGDTSAIWAQPDRLLFHRQGALMAVAFDVDRTAVRGEPVAIDEQVGFDGSLSRAAFSVSDDGVLVSRRVIAGPRQLVWLGRDGVSLGQVGPIDSHAMAAPELSRDERNVAVVRTLSGNTDVWVVNVAGGVSNRITFNEDLDLFPVWSPDSTRLVFTSVKAGRYNLYTREVGGSLEQALLPSTELRVPTSYSRDGRQLLFSVQVPGTGVDIWALPLDGDRAPRPVIKTRFDEMAGQLSADSRWIAYQSNSSGRMEVYLSLMASPSTRQQVSSAGGSQPRWSHDSRELFYIAADGQLMAVPLAFNTNGTIESGAPAPLFRVPLAAGANIPPAVGSKPQFDVAADGRFLVNMALETATAPPLTVAVNWRMALASRP